MSPFDLWLRPYLRPALMRMIGVVVAAFMALIGAGFLIAAAYMALADAIGSQTAALLLGLLLVAAALGSYWIMKRVAERERLLALAAVPRAPSPVALMATNVGSGTRKSMVIGSLVAGVVAGLMSGRRR